MKISRKSLITGTAILCLAVATLASSSPTLRQIFQPAGFDPSSVLVNDLSRPVVTARYATSNLSSFHFLEPLAPRAGDFSKFDASLLKYLTVDVCEVTSSDCLVVKTFTSSDSSSTQLRITTDGGNSYYVVNWDSSKFNLGRKTYRVRVSIANLQLGSIDLTPDVYTKFGRTWPIKFLIEKDPVIRVRLLRYLGKSAWQIAAVLRGELNVDCAEIARLLASDQQPFTQEEIDQAVNGVCQNVVVPATTKISDEMTRNALLSFDTGKGRMVFSTETPLLKNLSVYDVIVSEPGPGAPYGYLRKVTSIRKNKGQVILETVQAKLTEAIYQGQLDASGELRPSGGSLLSPTASSKSLLNDASAITASLDEGQQFNFQKDIDVTLNLAAGQDGLNGTGTVRVQGLVYFNAGYNLGMGIESCFEIPPVCVDRVEAWMGVEQKSHLKVTGNFDGFLHKEAVIDTVPLDPIVFFIGPVPVVLVPTVNIVLGVDGEAHINFSFEAEGHSKIKVGAKWTDPDDNGIGWEDLSEYNPLDKAFVSADINGTIRMEAFGKVDAKLLLYGVFGPGLNSSLGVAGYAQSGGKPLWRIKGHVNTAVNVGSDAGDFFGIGEVWSHPILNEYFDIQEAANQPPVFYNVRSGVIPVDLNKPVVLGPIGGGVQGFFDVRDPEGDTPSLSVTSSVDGSIGLTHTFTTAGPRTVKITATDTDGKSASIFLAIDVRNSIPILWVTPTVGSVAAGDQFFVTARAYDPEDGFLPCSRISWVVVAPDVRTVKSGSQSCVAAVIFNQQGQRTVKVRVTDSLGATLEQTVNVTVGPPPANRAPVIDLDSFKIYAARGPFSSTCASGYSCEAPDNSLLFNGVNEVAGDFVPPLTMEMNVTDPEGDPFIVNWYCQTGDQFAPITYNTDGSASCSPYYSATEPILVYALVVAPPDPFGDGGGYVLASSPVYHYTMLQIVR